MKEIRIKLVNSIDDKVAMDYALSHFSNPKYRQIVLEDGTKYDIECIQLISENNTKFWKKILKKLKI